MDLQTRLQKMEGQAYISSSHRVKEKNKVVVGKIFSKFTGELLATQKALNEYINFQETETAKEHVIFSDFSVIFRELSSSKAALQAIQKETRDFC